MRSLHTDEIIRNVKEMCIEANLHLSEDMEQAIRIAQKKEKGTLGKQILGQLCENMDIPITKNNLLNGELVQTNQFCYYHANTYTSIYKYHCIKTIAQE